MSSILVVDDDVAVLDSFGKFFKKDGHTPFLAHSAKEAMEILKEKQVDLAFLDVLMPEKSGIDLARDIRKNPKTKDLKIIFLTVVEKSSKDVGKWIIEVNASDWLQKPIDAVALREAVKKVLGEMK